MPAARADSSIRRDSSVAWTSRDPATAGRRRRFSIRLAESRHADRSAAASSAACRLAANVDHDQTIARTIAPTMTAEASRRCAGNVLARDKLACAEPV